MYQFDGKRVVVTGGSRGIGAAIAREFSARGARVAIVARDAERARAAAAALGPNAAAFAAHVADETAVNDTFGAIAERFGGIDILVNNAGITRDNLLMRMKGEDWDEVMATNLRGTFLCARAALRPMLKQRAGRIVNVTSVIGLIGNAGQGNYAASKAGIIAFTKSLAKEVASRGITANAVAPGLIATEMTSAMSGEAQKNVLAGIPLGRFGAPEDVAAAVLFLASDAAAYITGEVLRVDGGLAM
ncbi:MAG: 3-oxoacyl-[acyl-carrier-protein] reductase [Planctomycetes bacterium]|nr:3-oxoacyl-[acyl-carrier-protein] reductase [Planctomycetota bacterium]